MNNAKIKKTIEEGILDLWVRDITELIANNNMEGARSMGKYLGVSKEEINKIIQEYKNGELHNEL